MMCMYEEHDLDVPDGLQSEVQEMMHKQRLKSSSSDSDSESSQDMTVIKNKVLRKIRHGSDRSFGEIYLKYFLYKVLYQGLTFKFIHIFLFVPSFVARFAFQSGVSFVINKHLHIEIEIHFRKLCDERVFKVSLCLIKHCLTESLELKQ